MMLRGGIGPRKKILLSAGAHGDLQFETMFRQVGTVFKNQRLLIPGASLHSHAIGSEIPQDVLAKREKDMPVELKNDPYEKEKPKCILCKYDVKLDYKNVRLLSQFVSSFSGKVYGRHVTGICERQQQLLLKAVKKARGCGLMPYYNKDINYLKDPQLFDPERPFRPHKY